MNELVNRIEREIRQPRHSPAQKWVRRATVAVVLLLLPLVLAELYFRISGYYRPQIPLDVQSRTNAASARTLNQRFHTDAFVIDRFLLWRQKPGANLGGLAVDPRGFLAQEARSKPPKTPPKRILCLGDSVSAVTYRTFPHIAGRLAEIVIGAGKLEFTNASVAGYSSEQGLRWLSQIQEPKPDAIVICFGWNDHFPALNLADKELGARNAMAAFVHRYFSGSRFYQYLSRPRRHNGSQDPPTTQPLRVAPGEYKRNLVQFVNLARKSGAVAILATQPQNLNTNNLSYYFGNDFRTNDDLASYHHQYNMIVREVAAETGSPLLDLDEEFDRRNKDWLLEPDGMHLTGPGHNLAARLLISELRNQQFITPGEFERIVQYARYDTSAPDKPRAAWVTDPQATITSASATVNLSVMAKNTGNSTWLREHRVAKFGLQREVPYGGVSITATWRSVGAPTTGTVAQSRISHDLFPGESTSTTLEFAAPPAAGIYAMEIGLRADALGDLKNYGAEVTTVTVATR